MNELHRFPVRPERAYVNSLGLPAFGPWQQYYGGFPYPGQGGNFTGLYPNPYVQSGDTSLSGKFNMGQIKALFDRMGGIDGILGTMVKVQKIVQSIQQMSPLLKLLASSLFKRAQAKTAADVSGNGDGWPPAGRKKRKRRKSAMRNRSRSGRAVAGKSNRGRR